MRYIHEPNCASPRNDASAWCTRTKHFLCDFLALRGELFPEDGNGQTEHPLTISVHQLCEGPLVTVVAATCNELASVSTMRLIGLSSFDRRQESMTSKPTPSSAIGSGKGQYLARRGQEGESRPSYPHPGSRTPSRRSAARDGLPGVTTGGGSIGNSVEGGRPCPSPPGARREPARDGAVSRDVSGRSSREGRRQRDDDHSVSNAVSHDASSALETG